MDVHGKPEGVDHTKDSLLAPAYRLIPPRGGGGRLESGSFTTLSKDGRSYAYLQEHVLYVRDVASGKLLLRVEHGSAADKAQDTRVLALAVSDDGSLFATATQSDVRIWKLGSETPVHVVAEGASWLAFWGGELWKHGRRQLSRIDVQSGALSQPREFHYKPTALLGDGRILYVSFRQIKTLDVNNLSEVIFEGFEGDMEIAHVALSGSFSHLVVSFKNAPQAALVEIEGKVVLASYDLSALPHPKDKRVFSKQNVRVALSPDERHVLVVGGFVWTLDAKTGAVVHVLNPNEPNVASLAGWQPVGFVDDHQALLAGGHLLKLDLTTREELLDGEVFPRTSWSLAWSPDASMLLSGHIGFVYLWDLARGGHCRVTLEPNVQVHSAVFTADGRRAWVASWEGGVFEIDVEGALVTNTLAMQADCLAASPDGTRYAVSGANTIRLFEGSLHGKGHKLKGAKEVFCMSFDGTGTRLAANIGKQIFVWDVAVLADPREVLKVKAPSQGVQSLAIDEGRLLVFSSEGTVHVYGLDSGKAEPPLGRDFAGSSAAAFSPDGGLLFASVRDGAQLLKTDLSAQWAMPDRVSKACFSQDGRQLAVELGDNSLAIVRVPTPGAAATPQAPSEAYAFDEVTMGMLVAGRGPIALEATRAEIRAFGQAVQDASAKLGLGVRMVAAGDLNWCGDDERVWATVLIGIPAAAGGSDFPSAVERQAVLDTLSAAQGIEDTAWAAIGEALPGSARQDLASVPVALHLTCVGPLAAASLVYGVEGDEDLDGEPGEYHHGQDMSQNPHTTGVWGERVGYVQFESPDTCLVELSREEVSGAGYFLIARYD